METSILQKLNLNENEILIYEELLKGGEQTARQLALKTPLKRGLVYKTLEDLEKKGLIIKNDETNKVSTFTPIHPNVLKGLAEQQLKQAKEAKEELDKELGSLVSMYNLANNKPGVEFYEGQEGLEKVFWDTLSDTNTTIYTYVDSFSIDKEIKKLDKAYVSERLKRKIHKKILMADNEASKKYTKKVQDKFTQIKLVKNKNFFTFYSVAQIYNNKVSFSTFQNNQIISVVINDESIYKMHRFYFEALWSCL